MVSNPVQTRPYRDYNTGQILSPRSLESKDSATAHSKRFDNIKAVQSSHTEVLWQLTTLSEEHNKRFDAIDARLSGHDKRFDKIEQKQGEHSEMLREILELLRRKE